MADYPPNEIVDMIVVLGESQNNYRATARLYAERYPDRRPPNDRAMRRQCRRHVYNENDNPAVVIHAIIHFDPRISARRPEWGIGISRSTFLRIMTRLRYHV